MSMRPALLKPTSQLRKEAQARIIPAVEPKPSPSPIPTEPRGIPETKTEITARPGPTKAQPTPTTGPKQFRVADYAAVKERIIERRKESQFKLDVEDELLDEDIKEVQDVKDDIQAQLSKSTPPEEKKVESDIETLSDSQSELGPETAKKVESWLKTVNPLSADSREKLENLIAELGASIGGLSGELKEAAEQQLTEAKKQLASIKEAEVDISNSLTAFMAQGNEAIEFVTSFMKDFYEILRKKINSLWSVLYNVMFEMLPKLASDVWNAIKGPLKLMAGKAWQAIAWTGEKVAALSGGFSSAVKYLKSFGAKIGTSAWDLLKKIYGKTGEAASTVVNATSYALSNVIWFAGRQGGKAIMLVGNVWKAVTSPTSLLLLAAVQKYITSIWNDPIWSKFMLEMLRFGRQRVCELISNAIYTARYEDTNAWKKAKQDAGDLVQEGWDLGTWFAWDSSTKWMTNGGLKKTIDTFSGKMVTGLTSIGMFKTGLSLVGTIGGPMGIGAGAYVGSALDSAFTEVATAATTAVSEAAEETSKLMKKKALLLEHWNFWISFFTDPCVYPRVYTFNSSGWTQSTVDLLGGWFTPGTTKQTSAGEQGPIALTQEHIDLENNLKALREELVKAESKFEQEKGTMNATQNAEFKAQIELIRKTIHEGEMRTIEFTTEAVNAARERAAGEKNGLWTYISANLPLPDSSKATEVAATLGEWIFNQSDLTKSPNAEVQESLQKYSVELNNTKQGLQTVQKSITDTKKKIENSMRALKAYNDANPDPTLSWNPLTWVAGGPVKLDEQRTKLTAAIQAEDAEYQRLLRNEKKLSDNYLSLIIKVSDLQKLADKPSANLHDKRVEAYDETLAYGSALENMAGEQSALHSLTFGTTLDPLKSSL